MFYFILFLSSAFSQLYTPDTNENWEIISPVELKWCESEIENLDLFLEETDTKAFVILKDGKIAYEKYFNDFGRDSIWYWASAGKSLLSTLVGIAVDEKVIDLSDKSSKYLGEHWTSLAPEKEDLITIRHQLTMTTGLDEKTNPLESSNPDSLTYKADAGDRWYYYNVPYLLLHNVLENAYSLNLNQITNQKIKNKIKMQGLWFGNVFYSKALDAARFGLLIMNNGVWGGEKILNFENKYFSDMSATSSEHNLAYGYLWWLNGKSKYKQPGIDFDFTGSIVPNADAEMFMAAGKNDQRIYIDRKNGLVIVRFGNPGDEIAAAISGYDNKLWEKVNDVICNINSVKNQPTLYHDYESLKNYLKNKKFRIFDINGKQFAPSTTESLPNLPKKQLYYIRFFDENDFKTIKVYFE